ncbi:hypothetical protein [Bacillus sp. AFS017336]|uniref:hypothetical protein n=1 Tax=Bacillus sp. AFS017336 TaxID=2033489 RepID=UPI000BEF7046|nr:hypothetical protein [Bacillus sp. AFS017336]PEK99753.1 hypothetical protein CN601_23060 [Bacillus sp. AFS017336]
MNRKKILYYVLFTILFVLIFGSGLIREPIKLAEKLVDIHIRPSYLPINYSKSFATTKGCGRNCDIIQLVYKNSKEEITITASENVSSYKDSKWNKKNLIPGTKFYYRENSKEQLLNWRNNKKELEMEIKYKGSTRLSQNKLMKIANSTK